VINDVITTTVAGGTMLFVIMAWITIHFGRNPKNGGSPPKDNSYVNIMNFFFDVSLYKFWRFADRASQYIYLGI